MLVPPAQRLGSMMRPAYITATRSATWATTPRSWVMNNNPSFNSRRKRSSRFRICFCTVTSSAVVGSSAIRSSGPAALHHGNHGALPQATGKLVWKLFRAGLGFADAGDAQTIERLALHVAGLHLRLTCGDGFFDPSPHAR